MRPLTNRSSRDRFAARLTRYRLPQRRAATQSGLTQVLGATMNMPLLIAICTMPVPGFLFFGKIGILNNRRLWMQMVTLATGILILSIALFIAGIIGPVAAVALGIPIYQLLLFRVFYTLFLKWKKREPRDSSLVFSPGLAADRAFSIVYTVMAMISPFAWIGPMIWDTQRGA